MSGQGELAFQLQSKPCILLVEDESLVALDLEHELTDAGYRVILASSGARALAALHVETNELVAIVTDIRLGTGADGWEVAKTARQINPAVAIVYMSGDSASDWASEGVPSSVMLSKPFAGAQLITAVSSLLNATQH